MSRFRRFSANVPEIWCLGSGELNLRFLGSGELNLRFRRFSAKIPEIRCLGSGDLALRARRFVF